MRVAIGVARSVQSLDFLELRVSSWRYGIVFGLGRWAHMSNRAEAQTTAISDADRLIPAHGGFEHLKTFQLAQLIFDVTVRFCSRYIDRKSRTYDQMVQAARSGKQNIAEASIVSGTSKKSELKLTNIARGSLKELALDYGDFLRGRDLEPWEPHHPALMRFKAKRCATLHEVRAWVQDERQRSSTATRTNKDQQGHARIKTLTKNVSVRVSPCRSVSSAVLVANAALSLLNLCTYLLQRQIARLENDFLEHGGFTERLYRVRSQRRARSVQP